MPATGPSAVRREKGSIFGALILSEHGKVRQQPNPAFKSPQQRQRKHARQIPIKGSFDGTVPERHFSDAAFRLSPAGACPVMTVISFCNSFQ